MTSDITQRLVKIRTLLNREAEGQSLSDFVWKYAPDDSKTEDLHRSLRDFEKVAAKVLNTLEELPTAKMGNKRRIIELLCELHKTATNTSQPIEAWLRELDAQMPAQSAPMSRKPEAILPTVPNLLPDPPRPTRVPDRIPDLPPLPLVQKPILQSFCTDKDTIDFDGSVLLQWEVLHARSVIIEQVSEDQQIIRTQVEPKGSYRFEKLRQNVTIRLLVPEPANTPIEKSISITVRPENKKQNHFIPPAEANRFLGGYLLLTFLGHVAGTWALSSVPATLHLTGATSNILSPLIYVGCVSLMQRLAMGKRFGLFLNWVLISVIAGLVAHNLANHLPFSNYISMFIQNMGVLLVQGYLLRDKILHSFLWPFFVGAALIIDFVISLLYTLAANPSTNNVIIFPLFQLGISILFLAVAEKKEHISQN